MKQQNKITAWLLGAFCLCTAAALTSCRNEADMDPFITASEADIVLQADGLTEQGQPGEFELAANQSWKLIDKPQWVVLNHEEGLRGRHKIYVSAQANTTGEDREGYLERSEEHTSELQSRQYLVCRLLLEKKKIITETV